MTHQHHMWCKPGDPCWPRPTRVGHQHDPYCGHFTPKSVRWWLSGSPRIGSDPPLTHFGTLLDLISAGRSADDTVALDWCFRATVIAGGGDLHGNLCICLREKAPSAAEARGGAGGDSTSSLTCIKASLEEAADKLPIGWTSTQQIFEIQCRATEYQERLGEYRSNHVVRDEDRWLEPRDPETRRPISRQLAYFSMAVSLGYPSTCRWPRAARIETMIETALTHELKEAA